MNELLATYTAACNTAKIKVSDEIRQMLGGRYPEEVEELDFSRVYLPRKAVPAVGEVVGVCRNIGKLNFEGCQLENGDVAILREKLEVHPNLESLNFKGNPVSLEGGKILLEICKMNPGVKSVNLEKTLISDVYVNRINLQLELNQHGEIDEKDLGGVQNGVVEPDEEWEIASNEDDNNQYKDKTEKEAAKYIGRVDPVTGAMYDEDADVAVEDILVKRVPEPITMHGITKRMFSSEEKWTDPSFPPNHTSLITTGSLRSNQIKTKSIHWTRAPNSKQCTTPRLFTNQTTPSPPIPSPHWATNWLLNSLLTLLRHPQLLINLFLKANPDVGAYEIQLYKSGEWHRVIIDDWLPCSSDGTLLTITTTDPNELWAPLLEKAFAKLYGGYDRIETGSTVMGLVDLTGSVTHNIYLRNHIRAKEIVQDGSYWRALRGYLHDGWIVAPVAKTADVVEKAALVETGILANFVYEILEVTEVAGWRLVLLYTAYSEQGTEGVWLDEAWLAKRSETEFKPLHAKLSNVNGNQRWITFENFAIFFNKTYVCRCETATAVRYQYLTEKINSAWTLTTAGGRLWSQYFTENPCWCLRVKDKDTPVLIQLSVPDPRVTGRGYPGKIGVYVVKSNDPSKKKRYWDAADCIIMPRFILARDVIVELLCQPCINYFVVPATEDPGVLSPFQLSFISAHPYNTEEVPSHEVELKCESEWRSLTAGGRTTGASTWKNNPQFVLHVAEPGSFGFSLCQKKQNKIPFFISFTVYKSEGGRLIEHDRNKVIVSPPFVPYATAFTECDLLQGDYTIIPMTWSPGEETPFELLVFTSCKATLVPLMSLLSEG